MRAWLSRVAKTATQDYAMACEIAECQRLIKGYGDTHARGMANYTAILDALDRRPNASPEWTRQLREAALADETGGRLQALLAAEA